MIDFLLPAALTFDCYGTLIDWEAGLTAILERWAARSGVQATREQLLAAFAEAESRAEAEYPSLAYPDILRRVVEALGDRFHAPADEGAGNELAHSVGDWPPFPDTVEALRSLKRHYKLAVVSNVDRASFARTNAHLGIDFDVIVTAEDACAYKPNVAHFHRALDSIGRIGVPKQRVLHVAQSLYHDHVPAKSLGLSTVWINRRIGKPGYGATLPPDAPVNPDAEYPSMGALATAVEAAFSTRK